MLSPSVFSQQHQQQQQRSFSSDYVSSPLEHSTFSRSISLTEWDVAVAVVNSPSVCVAVKEDNPIELGKQEEITSSDVLNVSQKTVPRVKLVRCPQKLQNTSINSTPSKSRILRKKPPGGTFFRRSARRCFSAHPHAKRLLAYKSPRLNTYSSLPSD